MDILDVLTESIYDYCKSSGASTKNMKIMMSPELYAKYRFQCEWRNVFKAFSIINPTEFRGVKVEVVSENIRFKFYQIEEILKQYYQIPKQKKKIYFKLIKK